MSFRFFHVRRENFTEESITHFKLNINQHERGLIYLKPNAVFLFEFPVYLFPVRATCISIYWSTYSKVLNERSALRISLGFFINSNNELCSVEQCANVSWSTKLLKSDVSCRRHIPQISCVVAQAVPANAHTRQEIHTSIS